MSVSSRTARATRKNLSQKTNKQTKENCCLFLLILEEATHCVLECEPPLGVGVGDNTVALFSAKAKSSEHREKRLFSVTEKTSVSFCIFFFFFGLKSTKIVCTRL